MSVLLLTIGALLLAVAMIDMLWTTISTSGAGPATKLASGSIWYLGKQLHPRGPGRALLPILGPASLLLTMAGWILMLWAGYLLVFSAYPADIVLSDTKAPADVWERIYFTGFTIFTLGVGDVTPASDLYRVITAVASLNGLFMVTLSITYLVPVLSAVTEKRSLACQIHSLGETPQAILRSAWDGESLQNLEPCLRDLAGAITLHAQRHLSYPVLHHFQARTRRDAFPPQFATLSEAVMLLRGCVPREVGPSELSLGMLEVAIDEYMRVIRIMYGRPSRSAAPASPDLQPLRDAGIPICDDQQIQDHLARHAEHRCMLLALVLDQGWNWDEAIGVASAADDGQEVG